MRRTALFFMASFPDIENSLEKKRRLWYNTDNKKKEEVNMHLLKRLFNRTVLVALAVIFQVLLLVSFLTAWNDYFVWVEIHVRILSVVTLLDVFNRDMIPEAKTTWTVVILISPLFGVLIYFIFSRNREPRIHRHLFSCMAQESRRFLDHGGERTDENKLPPDYAALCRYIAHTSGERADCGTKAVFLESGERFFEALVHALEHAERFIFLEYFILQPGVMWNRILDILKHRIADGVEVRLIYDDMGCASKIPLGYRRRLTRAGIKVCPFNKYAPVLSAVHNNRDHRKIAVIDGKVGFVGGVNLADEYINVTHPYGVWKDTAVELTGPAVNNLTAMFLQSYVTQSKHFEPFEPYMVRQPSHPEAGEMILPYADGPKPMYRDAVAEQVYLHLIECAKHSLWITTPYLIPDHRMLCALEAAAKRGVDVRIVTPHIPDKRLIFLLTRSNYRRLQQAGVRILEYTPGFIHAKQLLCDRECAVVGSVNLDYRSLVHHFECGVILYGTPAVEQVGADFDNLFLQCQPMDHYRQGVVARLVSATLMVFTPML